MRLLEQDQTAWCVWMVRVRSWRLSDHSLHRGGSLVYSWTLTKLDLNKAEHQSEGQAACCQEVFKLWLKGPYATWGNLIEPLIDCEQTALAEQVKDALGL